MSWRDRDRFSDAYDPEPDDELADARRDARREREQPPSGPTPGFEWIAECFEPQALPAPAPLAGEQLTFAIP